MQFGVIILLMINRITSRDEKLVQRSSRFLCCR